MAEPIPDEALLGVLRVAAVLLRGGEAMKCLECGKPEAEWTSYEGPPCCSGDCLDAMTERCCGPHADEPVPQGDQ